MISLLVCSRVSGNKNFALFDLLESLKFFSHSHDNFEVLIKFDSDDRKAKKIIQKLGDYPFTIKYIVESRGRGYIDLHVFYNRLFTMIDDRTTVVGALADDFQIDIVNWDNVILDKARAYPDGIFLIHNYEKEYKEQGMFDTFDLNTLSGSIYFDEAPLWSRKLLEICGGLGQVSFTDAWTVALEYYLWHRCGMDRTMFLEKPLAIRASKKFIDSQLALRWYTDRANNFSLMRSNFYREFVEQQATSLYCYIEMARERTIPLQHIVPESDYPVEDTTMPTRIRLLNRFPAFMRPALIKLWLAIK